MTNDDLFDVDAVINISEDGEAVVEEVEKAEETVNEAADKLEEKLEEKADEVTDKAENAAEAAEEKAEKAEEKFAESVNETADKAEKKLESVGEKFADGAEKAAEKAKSIFSKLAANVSKKADEFEKNTQAKEKVSEFASKVSKKVGNIADTVETKVSDGIGKVNEKVEQRKKAKADNESKSDSCDETIVENDNKDSSDNSENKGCDCTKDINNGENSGGNKNSNNNESSDTCDGEKNSFGTENKHSSVSEEPFEENIESGSEETYREEEIEKVEGNVVGSFEDKFSQFRQKVGDSVKKYVPEAKAGISTGAGRIKEGIKNLAPKVKETATEMAPVVKQGVKDIIPAVKQTAEEVAPKVKDAAKKVGPFVKETAKKVGPFVKDTTKKVGPKVRETARNIGPKVKETASEMGPKVKAQAKNAAETVSFETFKFRHNLKRKMKDALKEKIFGKRAKKEKVYRVRDYGNNFLNHGKTIIDHRHAVFKHCVKAGIPLQGVTHDLSKFSPAEFRYGVKYFKGDKSPNEGEREAYGYSIAWMHHKGRNKHHFEYWTDYNIEANKMMPVKMPLKYVIEMFCDRVAASKVYMKEEYNNKAPYEYFDKGRARRTINKETSDFLEKLLKMLSVKGEDYTFTYIRWYMKHHKDY